jgi:Mrp family chromosome partitioning ATPase
MTIINRALTKAYQRRSDAAPGNAGDERVESVSGWAPRLRDPLRPIPAAAPKTAAPPAIPITRDETAVPEATSDAQTATVRVDLAHVILGHGVAKPQAAVIAASVEEPPAVATEQDDVAGDTAPIGTGAGATVRVDPGHVVAKPQALADAEPAEPGTAAGTEQIAIDAAPRWSWPAIVSKLLDCSAGAELRRLAASLKHLAVTRRLACLALSGPGRGTGRTSLVLTLAHILAETQSCRVAIVDADFGHPEAADLLSLRPRRGLWEAACDKVTAASAVMPLVAGKLSVVPLVERIAPGAIDRTKIAALQSFLRSLRRDNDLVLVDAGPWEALVPPVVFESRAVDALLCVARGDAGEERLDDAHYRQPGVEWLGMIETFVPPEPLKEGAVGGPTL